MAQFIIIDQAILQAAAFQLLLGFGLNHQPQGPGWMTNMDREIKLPNDLPNPVVESIRDKGYLIVGKICLWSIQCPYVNLLGPLYNPFWIPLAHNMQSKCCWWPNCVVGLVHRLAIRILLFLM